MPSGYDTKRSPVIAKTPSGYSPEASTAWDAVSAFGQQLSRIGDHAAAQQQQQAVMSYLGGLEVDARKKRLELMAEHPEDPQAFDAAWQGYRKGAVEQADPRFVAQVGQTLDQEGSAGFTAVSGARMARDRQNAADTLDARLTMNENDLFGMAQSGATNSEEFNASLGQYDTWLNNAVSAGIMAPEKAALMSESIRGRTAAEGLIYTLTGKYQETGAQQALAWAREGIAGLQDLTPGQRITLMNRAEGAIRDLETVRKANLAGFKADATLMSQDLAAGVPVPQADFEQLQGSLLANGGSIDAAKLGAAYHRSGQLQDFARLPADQQIARMQDYLSGGGFASAVINAESGGDVNAKNPRSSAEGPGQFIDQTWLSLVKGTRPDLAEGKSDAEILALRKDPALSAQMVDAYAQQNAQALGADGLPTDPGTLYAAHVFGPAGAAALLKAPADAPVADVLGQNVVDANPNLAGKTAGEVRQWAANTIGAATPGLDGKLVVGMRAEMQKRAGKDWTQLKAQLDAGQQPLASDINRVVQQAGLAQDYVLLDEIAERLDRAGPELQFQGLSPDAQQATIDQLTQQQNANGLSTSAAATLRQMEQIHADTVTRLKSDPFGLGVDRNIAALTPLDKLGTPDGPQQMADRLLQARKVEAHYPSAGTVVPFRENELADLKARWDTGNADSRSALLGTLSDGMDGKHYLATLAKIAPDNPVFGWAGGLWKENPDIARSIMRGVDALAADKAFAPKAGDTLNATIADKLGSAMSGLPAAREAAIKATMARYADLASQAGDNSGILDDDRFDRALNDVTGGIAEWRGAKLVLPPGMDEPTFANALDAVSDLDLAGAQTTSGSSVSAADFRRLGKLVDAGSGRYAVLLNGQPVLDELGRAFTLDVPRIAARAGEANRPADFRPFVPAGPGF